VGPTAPSPPGGGGPAAPSPPPGSAPAAPAPPAGSAPTAPAAPPAPGPAVPGTHTVRGAARLGRVPKATVIGGVAIAAVVAAVVTLKAVSGGDSGPSVARPEPTAVTTAPVPTTIPSAFSPAPLARAFVHACDLLTPADATRVLGVRVAKASTNSESGGVSVCQYFAPNGPNTISLTEFGGDPTFFDSFKTTRTGAQDVSGVGEAAFFDTEASAPTLWVKQGDVALEVVGTGAVSKSDVVALAKDLAGRL
jgi:hypothetical protein